MKLYVDFFKPLIGFVLAFVGMVSIIPVFIIVAIAIKLDSHGPVFFLQERLGKKGRIFKIVKFRSMYIDNHNYKFGDVLTEDNPQITKVGKFIRKTSIDELPQLLNILKGDMSFIGPRPPLPHYPKVYSDYNDFEKQRFLVKPGVSGYAAVKQRAVHDWNKNIPLDVEYVNRISFVLDLQLFFYSLFAFFRTNNIYTSV